MWPALSTCVTAWEDKRGAKPYHPILSTLGAELHSRDQPLSPGPSVHPSVLLPPSSQPLFQSKSVHRRAYKFVKCASSLNNALNALYYSLIIISFSLFSEERTSTHFVHHFLSSKSSYTANHLTCHRQGFARCINVRRYSLLKKKSYLFYLYGKP